jgi:hypothetical protein
MRPDQKILFISISITLIILIPGFISAQSENGYHLFNPTPRDKMRPFSIDRPDVTESPISVDPGHFQFEGDLVKWVKDRPGESNRTFNFMSGLYKMGITRSWDIHIGLELYNVYQDTEGNTYDEGYGSTVIRLKHNFWGNDGESRTALGMIPYVAFLSGNPLDSDVVYGIGFPFSYGLNENYDLGAQPQFDFILNENGKYELSYFQTVVIGGPLVGEMDFYVEGLAIFNSVQNQFLVNGGLIYNISPNVKVDIATNVGVTKETPTRIYLGLSFRI